MAKLVVLISGKRKCGKDYLCGKISQILREKCTILRISEPLKQIYAEKHKLNFTDLIGDGPYKEKYRKDMIIWSDAVRRENSEYFCKAACDTCAVTDVWIVSDVRRKTDVKYFKETYGDKVKTVRICADLETRTNRGWTFTEGVDDVESECDLDNFGSFDLQLNNNNEQESEHAINEILEIINSNLK